MTPHQQLARDIGCHCDDCPLGKTGDPVIPDQVLHPALKKLVVIAETPAEVETEKGQFLVGPTGQLWEQRILQPIGANRKDFHVTNALLCWPKQKLSAQEWTAALQACQGRLQNELFAVGCNAALTYGGRSLWSMTGYNSVTQTAGYPVPAEKSLASIPVMPTWHPAWMFKGKWGYLPVLRIHTQRAIDLANGRLEEWDFGPRVTKPPYRPALLQILREKLPTAVDIETGGKIASKSPIRVIGFANRNISVSMEWGQDMDLVRMILEAEDIPKIFQNGFGYDRPALMIQHGIRVRGEVRDTLTGSLVIHHDVPHDLAFQCSVEFAAPRWKDDFRAGAGDVKGAESWAKRDIQEVKEYNCSDNVMEERLDARQQHRMEEKPWLSGPYHNLLELNEIAVDMSVRGMMVDLEVVKRNSRLLKRRWRWAARRVAEMAHQLRWGARGKGIPRKRLNVFSGDQLADLLFNHLRVPVTRRSFDTGEPLLDKSVLADLMKDSSPVIRYIAKRAYYARKWRQMDKNFAGGLLPLVRESKTRPGFGTVHPSHRPGGAVTLRWAVGSPPCNGIPKPTEARRKDGTMYVVHPGLRNQFVPHDPDGWFVCADLEQAELRAIALESGDQPLFDAFDSGKYIHGLNAADLFLFDKSNRSPDDATKTEITIAKNGVYLCCYGGAAPKLQQTLAPFLVHPPKLAMCEGFIRNWFRKHPAIQANMKRKLELAETMGFVENPLNHVRRFFWGPVEPEKVYNHFPQSTVAEKMREAIIEIRKELKWPIEGIDLLQHDELIMDGPDPVRLATLAVKHMTRTATLNGRSVTFQVGLQVGKRNWATKKKCTLKNIREVMNQILKEEEASAKVTEEKGQQKATRRAANVSRAGGNDK